MLVILAKPFVEMGFCDDWSYIRSAQVFANTGHLTYNGWAAMGLGWQIVWGGLFAKLFGFSFIHVRLATLPISAATIFFFHRILERLGATRGNATFGTLCLALSPVFIAMTASFMTDVYALFCTTLCIYLCLRALTAATNKSGFAWLVLAVGTNVIGGTVRQTAWLGVLVIVPCTLWLLKRRRTHARYMLFGALLLWLFGCATAVALLHWIRIQPYFVFTLHIVPPGLRSALPTLVTRSLLESMRMLFCCLLLLFPLLAAWFSIATRLGAKKMIVIAAAVGLALAACIVQGTRYGTPGSWTAPWLTHVMTSMAANGGDIPGPVPGVLMGTGQRAIVTVIVFGAFAMFLASLPQARKQASPKLGIGSVSWQEMNWLLLPFTLIYALTLVDLSAQGSPPYDRYLLTLQQVGIVYLVRWRQDRESENTPDNGLFGTFPRLSWVALAFYACFSVAGLHDWVSISRARLEAAEQIRRAGVSRTAIQAGVEYDSWTQLEAEGHINHPGIHKPPQAFRDIPEGVDFPPKCAASWLSTLYTPAVRPTYFLIHKPLPCVIPSGFSPVIYRTWLPPFQRQILIYKRRG